MLNYSITDFDYQLKSNNLKIVVTKTTLDSLFIVDFF